MSEGKSHKLVKAALLWCFCVFFLGTASEAGLTNRRGVNEPKVLAEFTIGRDGGPILVPVTFKGHRYLFLLDTGSSFMVFDTLFKHRLGEVRGTAKATTPGKEVTAEYFDAPEAFVGPLNIQDCHYVFCMDIERLDLIKDERVSGLIGMNFLMKYAVQIDFDAGTVSFFEAEEGGNPEWGQRFAIEDDSTLVPRIRGAVVSGIKTGFIIDTGWLDTGGLDRSVFEEIFSSQESKTEKALFLTLGGIVRERLIRTANLSVGPFEYEGQIFGSSNTSVLGLSFLSRHVVTFDFPNKTLYLQKGREFGRNDETDMSGLYLVRHSGRTKVYSVDVDSPADKAGIRAGDVIVEVGNKRASRYQIWQLRQLFMSGHKRSIPITIKRDGDEKKVSLVLERRI